MRKTFFIFLLLISKISFAQSNNGEPIFFVGPTLHYNIGNNEKKFSFGIEGSAWLINSDLPLPLGADLGVEFEKKKVRFYSEIQTGALLGLALGPVLEIEDSNPRFGFQTSVWGAFFLGLNFRYRSINSSHYFSPGMFFKVPLNYPKIFN